MSVIEVAIGYARDPGRFRVQVVDSPVGHASADVDLDVDGLLAGRRDIEQVLLLSSIPKRRIPTDEEQIIQDTGKALFTALLSTGEVAGRYRSAVDTASQRGEELRIVLRIDAPELAALPWEAMYDETAGGYVCRQHQLVRHIPVAAPVPPLTVQLPLRILEVVSAPGDLAPLDTNRERAQLTGALAEPVKNGLIELAWTLSATWAGIHDELMAGQWHVIHFIGHGDFDPVCDEGRLALTGEDGSADAVEASRFVDLLRQARPMPRLVVLNSCHSAAASTGDLFSGTAAALARSGVAAIAAMQYSITDTAAIAFARGFYSALARGRGVDDAVSAGRVAILGTNSRTLEWLTPVLYLRGSESHLFEVAPSASPAGTPQNVRHGTIAAVSWPPSERDFRLMHTLEGHTLDVNTVTFSPDGALLATGSADWTTRLWHTTDGASVHVLKNHTSAVTQVQFQPKGNLLATMSADRAVRVWDRASGVCAYVVSDFGIGSMGFSPDGALLSLLDDGNGTAQLRDAATGHLVHTFRSGSRLSVFRHTAPRQFSRVLFNPDGSLLAGITDISAKLYGSTKVGLWNVATGKLAHALTGNGFQFITAEFSPDGSMLAAGVSGTIELWDVATGTLAHRLPTYQGLSELSFNPDGTLLAAADHDHAVRLWDPDTGKCRHVLVGHHSTVTLLEFSPDSALLLTRSSAFPGRYDEVHVWDVGGGTRVRSLPDYIGFAAKACRPDGSQLAASVEGATVSIWAL
jgi:hypothetical protein